MAAAAAKHCRSQAQHASSCHGCIYVARLTRRLPLHRHIVTHSPGASSIAASFAGWPLSVSHLGRRPGLPTYCQTGCAGVDFTSYSPQVFLALGFARVSPRHVLSAPPCRRFGSWGEETRAAVGIVIRLAWPCFSLACGKAPSAARNGAWGPTMATASASRYLTGR